MTWNDVHGHDEIAEQFQQAILRGRLASSFLFVGPSGIGKRTFALRLAQTLLCEKFDTAQFRACQECPACQQVIALTHPDVILVKKPEDKSFIPVEQFIGDREHRMREGLCHDIAMKPFCGGRKIAIIDDADYLNIEGANCLLKTLEEPPPNSLLILIASSEQRQLPTIRSRCQIIRFKSLSPDAIGFLLEEMGMTTNRENIDEVVMLSNGSLERAMLIADPVVAEFRDTLRGILGSQTAGFSECVKSVSEFVDDAGKDASARRERMCLAIDLAIEHYRAALRSVTNVEVEERDAATSRVGESLAAECLERCLQARAHVAANVNQSTLLECWLDDLGAMSRSA